MILLLNRKTRNNSQEDKNGPGVIDIVEVIYQMNGRDRGGVGGGVGATVDTGEDKKEEDRFLI